MIPLKSSSLPIGICTSTGFFPSFVISWLHDPKKSAPILSILFMKAIRGTLYLSAWRHTFSDCGSTPFCASNTPTAPSSTLSERSTSTVKSTCPGVSIMLIRYSGCVLSGLPSFSGVQWHVVAAEVIVIPLSCSWAIQSIVAVPSWVSPILWLTPV